MTTRLTLIAHGSTRAARQAVFPSPDNPMDEPGAAGAIRLGTRLGTRLGRVDHTWSSPALACIQTAAALGLDADCRDALRDCDHGRWRGRSIQDVAAEEPDALGAWLSDPASPPGGGEAFADLLERVARWLEEDPGGRSGRFIAVTHASVIRAAILTALRAPASSFTRIDVAPLSATRLIRGPRGHWALHVHSQA